MKTTVSIDFDKICSQSEASGQTEAIARNLFSLSSLFQKNNEFRELLTHKRLDAKEKLALVKELPGLMPSPLFDTVFELLIQSNQITSLSGVSDKINTCLSEAHRTLLVHVETAIDLSPSFETGLIEQLKLIFNQKIILTTSVNPELIAGIVVKLPGGKVYDYSYDRLLSNVNHYLRERN